MREPDVDAPSRPDHSGGGHRPSHPRRYPRLMLGALVLSLTFGAGIGVDRVASDRGSDVSAASSFTDSPEFGVLQQTWNVIHDDYVEADKVNDTDLFYGAASGMVDALGDTGHSRFLNPDEAKEFEQETTGKFVGIGVELDIRDGRPIVIAPIDGSPADEAGVLPGDTILEVAGQSTDGLTYDLLKDLIRGDEGTSIDLKLRHPGSDSPYSVKLTRREITIRPISWRMLPFDVAQVRISEFSVGAAKALDDALVSARKDGATAVVLDLRNNPGGLVSEAIGVASEFMPEGTTIFQHQEKDKKPVPVKTIGTDGEWLDGPLVVLTNEYSASAAEIVAGALRDNGRAKLIGTKTFGTGTVLLPFEQDDGSVVLLGTALWLTVDGEQLWRKGVEPSDVVDLPFDAVPSRPSDDASMTVAELEHSTDAQLRAAYDQMTSPGDDLPSPPAP